MLQNIFFLFARILNTKMLPFFLMMEKDYIFSFNIILLSMHMSPLNLSQYSSLLIPSQVHTHTPSNNNVSQLHLRVIFVRFSQKKKIIVK